MRIIKKLRKTAAAFAALMLAALIVLQLIPTFPAVSSAESEETGAVTGRAQEHISIEADPPRLANPGYVTIKIKLRNTNAANSQGFSGESGYVDIESVQYPDEVSILEKTDEPEVSPEPTEPPTNPPVSDGYYRNVRIENSYGVQFSTSDVAPGQTGVFSGNIMITNERFGVPLKFTLYWYDSAANALYYKDLEVTVDRSNTMHLTLARTASTTQAAVGEEVTLTYSLVNTGTVRLNNIRVYDDKLNGSSPVAPAFALSSGESKEITFIYKMREASVISKPKAVFTTEGGSTEYTVEVSSKLTIGLVNAQISKEVTVGRSTPEGVNFTLFLTNNGSQSLHNLVVKDELGNTLAPAFSLAIGESRIIDHFVPNPDTVRNVSFKITGTYADGKEFKDNTTSYQVFPYIDPDLLGLAFAAEIRKPLDSSNRIYLTFTVQNTGSIPYSNVILTEKELGYNLHEIQTLYPTSDGETFNIDLTIEGPRELVFYLTAVDPSGNTYVKEAHITANYMNNEGAIPNQTPAPGSDTGVSIKNFALDDAINERVSQLSKLWKTLETVFFIALGIVLLLGIIELVLFIRNRTRRRRNKLDEME